MIVAGVFDLAVEHVTFKMCAAAKRRSNRTVREFKRPTRIWPLPIREVFIQYPWSFGYSLAIMTKSMYALIFFVFAVSGCTSLMKKPYYKMSVDDETAKRQLSYDSDGRPSGFNFKVGRERGQSESVWIQVLNEGGEDIYAFGIILPFIPDLLFEKPEKKMNYDENISIQVRAYANPGKVTQMTTPPVIETPDGKKHLALQINHTCGWGSCQIFTYNLTPRQAPKFRISETQTKLESGDVLKTPPVDFEFRKKVELIYHRGP